LLQDVKELVKRGRIEANGDPEMASRTENQFERGRWREDVMIG
jgi:hypothetical protein